MKAQVLVLWLVCSVAIVAASQKKRVARDRATQARQEPCGAGVSACTKMKIHSAESAQRKPAKFSFSQLEK
jgi:hypothetical protein